MHRPLRDFWLIILFCAMLTDQNVAIGKGLTFDELRMRSRQIEKMTLVERESLQRNWRTFQALSEDQKQRYRWLHQQLEDDRQAGNSPLNQTLQTYEAWLQTLAPGERAELREATTPDERLRKVREIKADKDRRNQSRALSDPAEDPSRPRWKFRRGMAPPLSLSELNAVMESLAEALPLPDQDDLKRLDPARDQWLRYSQIVKASARQAGGPPNWPNPEQQAKISVAIPKSETAQRLKSLPEDQRRARWGSILFSSFGEELMKQHDPFRPKPEDLANEFEQLKDHRQREELMSLPKERLKHELTRRYYLDLEGKNPDFRKLQSVEREFFQFAGQFMGQAGLFRGPPDRGRRFGPPDGRGPREERGRDGLPPHDDREFRPRREEDLPPPPPDRR